MPDLPQTTLVSPANLPSAVLDTNVVLDWLVFEDPSVLQLAADIQQGRLRWLGSAQTLLELEHVLARGEFQRWHERRAPALQTSRMFCQQVAAGAATGAPPQGMRCTDPDDQKFIDLALAQGARWLISRDKAVLRLARRARALGLLIVKPSDWASCGVSCDMSCGRDAGSVAE